MPLLHNKTSTQSLNPRSLFLYPIPEEWKALCNGAQDIKSIYLKPLDSDAISNGLNLMYGLLGKQ